MGRESVQYTHSATDDEFDYAAQRVGLLMSDAGPVPSRDNKFFAQRPAKLKSSTQKIKQNMAKNPNMLTSTSEFIVLDGSPLIGETMHTIAQKYHVTILHYHNPALIIDSKTPYDPTRAVRANFFLKVEGKLEDIARLRLDSVKFAQS